MRFRLRFPPSLIGELAGRFGEDADSVVERKVGSAARRRGYLTKSEFLALCEWKTPRTRPLCASNPEDVIIAATREALASRSERVRMESLTSLRGVGWPTASVILHFCGAQGYPILDVRALWSVSAMPPSKVDHEFWSRYVRYTRQLAARAGVTMRTLDRALWQYSKENQESV